MMGKIVILWPYTNTAHGDIHAYIVPVAVLEQFNTRLTENSVHTLRLFAEHHLVIAHQEYTSIKERATPGRKIDIWSQGNIAGTMSLQTLREKLLELGYYDTETPISQVHDIRAIQAEPVTITIGNHDISS